MEPLESKNKQLVKLSEDVKIAANNIVETSQIIKDGSKELAPVAAAIGVGLVVYAAAALLCNNKNDHKDNPS